MCCATLRSTCHDRGGFPHAAAGLHLFELLGDIVRNHVSPLTVGEYLLNVVALFSYTTTPLSMLLAVLVTFGLLQRSNEITAIKATGISLYRIIVPVLIASVLVAGRAFSVGPALYALHQQATGRPAQPDQGQARANLSSPRPQVDLRAALRHLLLPILRSRPRRLRRHLRVPVRSRTPSRSPHRIAADRAHWSDPCGAWVYEQGWERSLQGSAIESYPQFDAATYPQLAEAPAYFKKEMRNSRRR